MNPSNNYITLFAIPTLIRGIQHHNGSIPVNVDAYRGTPIADSLLRLRHDSLNEFDVNAVEVLDNVDGVPSDYIQPLGFLPRGLAKSLALIIKEGGDVPTDNPIAGSNSEVAITASPNPNDNIPPITVSAQLGWGTVKKWRTRTRHALSRALSPNHADLAHVSPHTLLTDADLADSSRILDSQASDTQLEASTTSSTTAPQPTHVTHVPLRDAARLVADWRRYGVEAPTSLPQRVNPLRWAWEEWATARDASAKVGVAPTISAASLPLTSSAVSIPPHTAPVTVTVAVHRTVVAALARLLHRHTHPATLPADSTTPAELSVNCADDADINDNTASAGSASATATPPSSHRLSPPLSRASLASLLLRLLCILYPDAISPADLVRDRAATLPRAPVNAATAEADIAAAGEVAAAEDATTPPPSLAPYLHSAPTAPAAPVTPYVSSRMPPTTSSPPPPLATRMLFPCTTSNNAAVEPDSTMSTTPLRAQPLPPAQGMRPSTHSHTAPPPCASPQLTPSLASPRSHTLALLRTLIRALLALATVPGLCEADTPATSGPAPSLLPPSTAAIAALTPLLSSISLPLPAPPPSLPAVLALLRELDGPAPTAVRLYPQRLLSLLSAVSAYNIPPAALVALPTLTRTTLARTRMQASTGSVLSAGLVSSAASSALLRGGDVPPTSVHISGNSVATALSGTCSEAEPFTNTRTIDTTDTATAVSANAAPLLLCHSQHTHRRAAQPLPWLLPLPPTAHALTHLSALYLVLLRALAPDADQSPSRAPASSAQGPPSSCFDLLSLTDVFVLSAFARLPLHLQRALAKLLCSGNPQPAARLFVPALAQALHPTTHAGDRESMCSSSCTEAQGANAFMHDRSDEAVRTDDGGITNAGRGVEVDVSNDHGIEALFSGLDLGAFAWVRVQSLSRHAHRSKPAPTAADGWAACVRRLRLWSSSHAGADAGADAASRVPPICSPRFAETVDPHTMASSASAVGPCPAAAAVGHKAVRRVIAAAPALSTLPATTLWPVFAAREEQRALPAALAELGALTAAHPLFAPLHDALAAATRLSGSAAACDALTPSHQPGIALLLTQPLFLEMASSLPPRHFICLSIVTCPKTLLQSLCKDLSVPPCTPVALLQRLARARGLDGVPLLDSRFTVRIVLKRCGDLVRVSRALEDAVVRMCAAARLAHSRAAQVSGRRKSGQVAGSISAPVVPNAVASGIGVGTDMQHTPAATDTTAPTAVDTLDGAGARAADLSAIAVGTEVVEEDAGVEASDDEVEDVEAEDAGVEGEDEEDERGRGAEAAEGTHRADEEPPVASTPSDSAAVRSAHAAAKASADDEAEDVEEEASAEGWFSVRTTWERHYGRHAREYTRMFSYSRRRRAASTQALVPSCVCGDCDEDEDVVCAGAWPHGGTLHALAALASGLTLRRAAQEATGCDARGMPLQTTGALCASLCAAAQVCEGERDAGHPSTRAPDNAVDVPAPPAVVAEVSLPSSRDTVVDAPRTMRTPLPHLHSLVLAALQRSETLFADLLRLNNLSARGGSSKRPRASAASNVAEDEEGSLSVPGSFTGGHDTQRQSAREKARAMEQESSALRDLCIRLCSGTDTSNAWAVSGVALLPPAVGVAEVCRCDAGHPLYVDANWGNTLSECNDGNDVRVGGSTGYDMLFGICPWCVYMLSPSTAPPASSSSSSSASAANADADEATLASNLTALAAQYQRRVGDGRPRVTVVPDSMPIAGAERKGPFAVAARSPPTGDLTASTATTAATALARSAPVWAGLCEADTALRWVLRAVHACAHQPTSATSHTASAEAHGEPYVWLYSWPHGLSFTHRPSMVTPVSAAKTLMLTVLVAANANMPKGPASVPSTATAALLPANATLALPWLPWRAFWRLARLVVSVLHRARAHAHAFVLMCHLLCLSLALQYRLYCVPAHVGTVLSTRPRAILDSDCHATAITATAGVSGGDLAADPREETRLAWWSMLVLADPHTHVHAASDTLAHISEYQRVAWARDTAARMCGARARNEWWELVPVLLKHVTMLWTSARKDLLRGNTAVAGSSVASATAAASKNVTMGGQSGRRKDARTSSGSAPAARQHEAKRVSNHESGALKQEKTEPVLDSIPRRQGNSWLRRLGGDHILGALAGNARESALSDDRASVFADADDAIDLALVDVAAADAQCMLDESVSTMTTNFSAAAGPIAVPVGVCVRHVHSSPSDGVTSHGAAVSTGAMSYVTCACACGHRHCTHSSTHLSTYLSCPACSHCPLVALLALGPAVAPSSCVTTLASASDGEAPAEALRASGPWWVVVAGSALDTTAYTVQPSIPTSVPPARPPLVTPAPIAAAVPAPALAALLALALPLASLTDPMLMFGPRRAALYRALAAQTQYAALVGPTVSVTTTAVCTSSRATGTDTDASAHESYPRQTPAACIPVSALAFDEVAAVCAALEPSHLASRPPSSLLSPLASLAADTATIARAVSELSAAARNTAFPRSHLFAANAPVALQDMDVTVKEGHAAARGSPHLTTPVAELYPATTLADLRASSTAHALAQLLWPLAPPALLKVDYPPTLATCDFAHLKRSTHACTVPSLPISRDAYPPISAAFAPLFLSMLAQASVTQRALVGRPSASIAGVKSRFHSLLEGSRPPLPSFCLASAYRDRVRAAIAQSLGVPERRSTLNACAASTGSLATGNTSRLHPDNEATSAYPFVAQLQCTDEHSRVINAEEWVALNARLVAVSPTATEDASLADTFLSVNAHEGAYIADPAAVRSADACPLHDSLALYVGAVSSSELEAEAMSSLALAPLLPRVPLAPFVTVEALAAEQYACDGWAATHSEGAVASALLRTVRAGMLAEAAESTTTERDSTECCTDRAPSSAMLSPHAFVRRLLSCCDHSGGGVCVACLRGVGAPLSALVERGWRVTEAKSVNTSTATPASAGSRATRVDCFDIGAALPIARCPDVAEAGPVASAELLTPCPSEETADEARTSPLPAPTRPTPQLSAVADVSASTSDACFPSIQAPLQPAPGPEAVSSMSLPALQAFAEAMGPMALATLLLPLLLHRPTHSGLPDVWMLRGTLLRPLPHESAPSPSHSLSSSPAASPAASRRPSPTKQPRPPTPATHAASSSAAPPPSVLQYHTVSLAELLAADEHAARHNTPLRHLLHPRQSAHSSPAAATEPPLPSTDMVTPAAMLDDPSNGPGALSTNIASEVTSATTPVKAALCLRPQGALSVSGGAASPVATMTATSMCLDELAQQGPSDAASPQAGVQLVESVRCLAMPKRISLTTALSCIARAGALTPRTQTRALSFLERVRRGAGQRTTEATTVTSDTVSESDAANPETTNGNGAGHAPGRDCAPVGATAVDPWESASCAHKSATFAALLTEVLLPRWAASARDEEEEVLVQLSHTRQGMDETTDSHNSNPDGVDIAAAMTEGRKAEHEGSDSENEDEECSSFTLPLATLTATGTSQPLSSAVGARATGPQNPAVLPTDRAASATVAPPLRGADAPPTLPDTSIASLVPLAAPTSTAKKSGSAVSPAPTTTGAPTPSKSASALALRLFARVKASGTNTSVTTPSAPPAARVLAAAVECIDLDSDEDEQPVPAIRTGGSDEGASTRLSEASTLMCDEGAAHPQQPPTHTHSAVVTTPRVAAPAAGRMWLKSGFTAASLCPTAAGLGDNSDSDLEVTEVVTVTPAKATALPAARNLAPGGADARASPAPTFTVSQRTASATKSIKVSKGRQSSSKRRTSNTATSQFVRSDSTSHQDAETAPWEDTTVVAEHHHRADTSSRMGHSAGAVVFSLTDSEDEWPVLHNRAILSPPSTTPVSSAEPQSRKRGRAGASTSQAIAAPLVDNLGSNRTNATADCAATPVVSATFAVDGNLSDSDVVNKRPRPSRSRTARLPTDQSASAPAAVAAQPTPVTLVTPVDIKSTPTSPAAGTSRRARPSSPLPPPPAPPAPLPPTTPPPPCLPPGRAALSLQWHANALLPLVTTLCAHSESALSRLPTDDAKDARFGAQLASAFPTGLPLPQLLVPVTTTLVLRTALALATSACNVPAATSTHACASLCPAQASASYADDASVISGALWSVQHRAIAVSQTQPDAPLFVPGMWGQRHRPCALVSQETREGMCLECLARLVEARVHRMLHSDTQCADVPCATTGSGGFTQSTRPACVRALTLQPHASAYVLLSEVKGPRDSLSRAQECWLELLAPLLRCEVAWVLEPRAWAAQETRVRKVCGDGDAQQETRNVEEQAGADEDRPIWKARRSRLKEEGDGACSRTTDPGKRSKRQKVEDDEWVDT